MWYCPDKYKKIITNVNDEMAKMDGSLQEKDARISLAKFLC